jgi:cytochrome c biogenesis protein CcdA
MSEWGWGPALIFAIGAMMVIWGVGAFISEVIRKARAHNRQMRQAQRRLGIMSDLKDLNS